MHEKKVDLLLIILKYNVVLKQSTLKGFRVIDFKASSGAGSFISSWGQQDPLCRENGWDGE
jgi:hypothetical protein